MQDQRIEGGALLKGVSDETRDSAVIALMLFEKPAFPWSVDEKGPSQRPCRSLTGTACSPCITETRGLDVRISDLMSRRASERLRTIVYVDGFNLYYGCLKAPLSGGSI